MDKFIPYSELKLINDKYLSTFNLWEGNKYKSNILEYKKDYQGLHSTQKPIALITDLVKTYSNEYDTVVDLTSGSFTTAISCIDSNRNFKGIEKESKFFDIGINRVEKHLQSKQI